MNSKDLIDINKPSFFLLVFPYLAFNLIGLYYSPFFSFSNLLGLLAILIGIDLIIKKIFLFSPINEKIFNGLILFFVLIVFYGNYLSIYTQEVISKYMGILLRGRFIFIFLIFFFIFILVLLIRKSISFKNLNIFLIVFSIINFTSSFLSGYNNKINKLASAYQRIYLNEKNNKPLILFIVDEYNSPDGLYKIFKDSSIYDFSNSLKKRNWIVRNSAYTSEISTIHSLSSLFNFNLSQQKNYSEYSYFDVGPNKLLKASIYDSLYQKNIRIINFGIFDIGKSEPLSSFYFYPKSFFDHFLYYTSLRKIIDNTGGLKFYGFKNSFYPTEPHNQFILENLADSLELVKSPKTFVYVHLLMPHSPFKYKSEFKLKPYNNLVSYKPYWDFTNIKLEELLSILSNDKKFRIILSGDHGFRSDKRINPNLTFMAFYGFDEEDLCTVQTVQDLGSLIDACFEKLP